MASSRNDSRRRSTSGSSRQHNTSRSTSRSRQARRSSDGRRPLQGRDTGYRVGSGRRQSSQRGLNPRLIIAGIVGILLIIAIIFGISSCVKGCSRGSKKQTETQEQKVNPDDKRVAYGVSSEETAKLASVLDRNETFAKIAKNANKISDERLIDLAIAEPEAIDFVAGSIKADGTSQPYADNVTQGEYPKLYTFDPRWGYLPYADGIVGVTGSGPVALSMASMGLTGKSSYDPATIAQAVIAANLASGSAGMDDSFVTNHSSESGVAATSIEVSSDGLYLALTDNLPVIVKVKADSGIGSSYAHWVLVAQ
ncbi:MAG: hypothetical protein IJ781_02470, partial [Atopobiaceae bacterium]|nr:hypothetical protein [Atopobiaceae bacterium]